MDIQTEADARRSVATIESLTSIAAEVATEPDLWWEITAKRFGLPALMSDITFALDDIVFAA